MPRCRKQLIFDLLPAVILLVVGTVLFSIYEWDLEWAKLAQDDQGGWAHGDVGLWRWLYIAGTLPAVIVVLAAVVVLILGLRLRKFARFRRPTAYIFLVLAIGPGLIANSILKDHWGRPRPRDVEALGGEYAFEKVLTIDPSSPGKSFPCGHATMGFFFFAGYFLLRARHRVWANACLVAALAYGTLIGIARLYQGGHFPSDTLWAAGVMWITAAVLARMLHLERPYLPPRDDRFQPVSWPVLCGVGLILPALIFVALLATPLNKTETYSIDPSFSDRPVKMIIKSLGGTVNLIPSETFSVVRTANGHGLPGSGYKVVWNEKTADDGREVLEFKQRESGITTEYQQTINATYLASATTELQLEISEGKLNFTLPANDVALLEPPVSVRVDAAAGTSIAIKNDDTRASVNVLQHDKLLVGEQSADWSIILEGESVPKVTTADGVTTLEF